MVLHMCDSLLQRNKFKVCACFYKITIQILTILTETPIRKIVLAFIYPTLAFKNILKAAAILKIVLKGANDMDIFLKLSCIQ
jgi:hypothetical protein